jgi:NNP family nitrate/nitrite transporter-like MFS transporter
VRRAGWNLGLATSAFALYSTAWSLVAGSGAVSKIVPDEFRENAGAAAGVVGAAGGLGGFFPPIFGGLVEDAEGTYTYGFVGLLVFVGLCLAPAARLLRAAPRHELEGARA